MILNKMDLTGLGTKLVEAIIEGRLCKPRCASHEDHSTITVWSSGAAEQLEAAVSAFLTQGRKAAEAQGDWEI